ncbi:tryptophan synthase subunit alpha [Candidatus Ishikawella capsulata]|uniref:Tryptophan synthase alpha chain n=1 Tax=Candidatus Ishikawaella capsulata Mpkobe TaxID=476281 RepID=C5WCA6_9ENTR|nr:tryptophan synthase subunit alpha [Candidatus Ishikawaella capsulata]BAH82962.1 tryptophan synthase subunit alpha [Candidatus Ishikawaella capsulata Mpkobe]
MKQRYKKLFKRLSASNEGALVPFIIIGDPSIEVSLKIIDTLINGGADALELGIPFSDPLADGPTIQKATVRAFNAGITVERCFEILRLVRKKYTQLPIGLLTYANLVFSHGINNFYNRCSYIDIDSVLVADVPIEYSMSFRESAIKNLISPVFICPPNAHEELIKQIASFNQDYTYLLSRPGVTGIENSCVQLLPHLIKKLRIYNSPPILQGFGISKPTEVKSIISSGVDGVILGSAIISIIEQFMGDGIDQMLINLLNFLNQIKAATKK